MRKHSRRSTDSSEDICRPVQLDTEDRDNGQDDEASVGPNSGQLGGVVQPHRVLVVEDEALIALDICDVVNEMGNEVVGLVATEADAVRQALEREPDLIIMDIKLKHDGSGLRASRRILAERDTAVLFITAFKDSKILQELREWPTAAVLFKPFNRSALQHAIEAALGQNPH